MAALNRLDIKLFEILNGAHFGPVWDSTMLLLSSREFWFVVIGFYFLYGFIHERFVFFKTALALSLTIVFTDWVGYRVFKQFVGRMRPCHVLDNVRLVSEGCGGDLSFPSNHAANGMAFVLLLWLLKRKAAYLWLLLPVLAVGLSRVILGVHYPFDVLGGFCFGAFSAALFYSVGRIFKVFR